MSLYYFLLFKYDTDFNSEKLSNLPIANSKNESFKNSKFALKMDSLYFNLIINKGIKTGTYGECELRIFEQ
jgi:hypothetical protein